MRWLAFLMVVLAACNSGDTDENPECGPNGMCPVGFMCRAIDNRCYRSDVVSDARPVDAVSGTADARPAPDAATLDAPAPADARPPTPDASGPVATITGGAEDGIAAATVTFTYTSSTAGATFECGLDGAFASCNAAGRTFTGLTDESEHTFRVRAIAGGVTGPAAARTFTVDAAAPVITITAPGSSATVGAMVTVTFTVSEPATLTCSVDSSPLATCASGMVITLDEGDHELSIEGVDDAGNQGSAGPVAFTVDATPPNVVFISPQDTQIVCPSFELLFETNPFEADATFTCGLDGEASEECDGGEAFFSDVDGGEHTVTVVATDELGNSATEEEDISVDADAPNIVIESAGGTLCSTGQLIYTASDPGGIRGPLSVVSCTMESGSCQADSGLIIFTGAGAGTQTLTLQVRDACGNVGLGTVEVTIDAAAPIFSNLTATPGPADSGTATLSYMLSEDGAVEGGIALVTPLGATPAAADFIPSCTCGQTSCSCSQLAAGTNVLAVRATDSCGLLGAFTTTTVNADFGPYAGHAVLLGHDYSDAATPDALVGNAVALAPFVSRALPINREARVLAFRAATGDTASVSKVKAAVEARLGAKFDASDPVSYREITESGLLSSLIRGRDVLLIYDPEDSLTSGQLDSIGASWASSLVSFSNGGGIVVALNGSSANGTVAGGTWRLVTPMNITGATAIPPPPNQLSSHTNEQFYPAGTVGTANFFLAEGAPASYAMPDGSSCFTLGDEMAATVYRLWDNFWWGDGQTYSFCPTVLDQTMPEYTLSVALNGDPVPGVPSCAPPTTNIVGTGTITATPQGGQPAPGGAYECYYGPLPDDRTTGMPFTACSTSGSQLTYDVGSIGTSLTQLLRVALTRGNRPERVTTVPFTVDDAVDSLSVTSPGGQQAHWCEDYFGVIEYGPRNLDALDQACVDSWPQWPYAPIKSATCQLWQYNGNTQNYTDLRATKTGAGCGLSLYNPADANGGYITNFMATVDWRSAICATNSINGFYRMVVTIEDYHGNSKTEYGSWFENPSTPAACCP